MSYRRNAFTWAAFGALFAFGYLNAVLGPALPYIRSVEGISYLVGALHQVAFAFGGGLAGTLSARDRVPIGADPRVGCARRRVRVPPGRRDDGGRGRGQPGGHLYAAADRRAGCHRRHLASRVRDRDGDRGSRGGRVLRADVPSPRVSSGEPTRRGRAQPTLVIIFAIVALEFALSLLARQLPQRRRRPRPRHRGRDGQRTVRVQPPGPARGEPTGSHPHPGAPPGHRAGDPALTLLAAAGLAVHKAPQSD